MRKPYKEFHILFFAVYVVFLVLGWYKIADYTSPYATAGSSDNLFGWAWSSNIGWISFNSVNCDANPADGFVDTSPPAPVGCPASGTSISNYGVNVKNNGELEGYAWSDHVGWISFNSSELNIPGCPSTDCTARRVGNELVGFARALKPATSGISGWDGWVSLNCKNANPSCINPPEYGVKINNPCDYDNYAWGSETVGWVHFKGLGYGVIGVPNSSACFYPVEIESASASPAIQHAGSKVNWTVYLKPGTGSGSYDFLWAGDAPLEGQTSNPAPTTYSVMGTYSGSITVTDTVTGDVVSSSADAVSIIAGITSFTATPLNIINGDSVLIQWTTTGFNDGDCALSSNPDDGNGVQSNLAAEGNYTSPALADSTTYTLSCTNLLTGDSDSKLLPVPMLKIPLFREVKPPVQ